MPRHNFKVGDFVRRINSDYHLGHNHMNIGDIGEVTSTTGVGLNIRGFGTGFVPENFELVTSSTSTPIGSTTMTKQYYVRYSDYIGYEDKLSYLKKDLGKNLTLSEGRLKTFLKKTGLQIQFMEETGVLNVYQVKLSEKPMLEPQVMEVTGYLPSIPKYPVSAYNWDGRAVNKHLTIAQQLLTPSVKRPIKLSVPHHRPCPVNENEDVFEVFIWSSPDYSDQLMPHTLFGRSVGCTDSPFRPSGQGVALEHKGFIYGELFPNCLYIHFDAVHCDSIDDRVIFAEMLKEAAAVISGADWKKLQEEREARILKAEEEAFQTFTRNSMTRIKSRNEADLRQIEAEIKTMRTDLFNLERSAAVLRGGGEEGIDAMQAQIMEEFRKLKNGFANIQEAKFSGQALTVITSPINSICKHTGDHYHLGRVRIQLPFSDAGSIFMTDPDEQRRIPHTSDPYQGRVCLGSAESEIHSYMANYEMLAAVSFMLAFLERGIDTGDEWGEELLNFPNLGG